MKVAFQGEPGAYSEEAIRQHFGPDVDTHPLRTFSALFRALHDGDATHVMLPIENSLAGTVLNAYDLLIDHDMRVQADVIVKVRHCLLAPKGASIQSVKRVISHPQALAQCRDTLSRMNIEPVTHYDTAGSARDLAANPEAGLGSIASQLAASKYDLEILVHDMQDVASNYTRFFVLSHHDAPRQDPSKTSIVFTTRHTPGALFSILGELANRNINLTKIESRARRDRPWHYRFHVDFEGHEDDRNVQEALMAILKRASYLKVLGSYPATRLPTS